MPEYENLSEIVGEIYDTTLDPERWTGVLASIANFIGSRSSGLVSKDPVSMAGHTNYFYNVDPHYIQLYAETYAKFDPLATLPPIGQVVSIPDLVHYDEYRRGPFYNEYLQPQGWVDSAIVSLEKPTANRGMLLIGMPKGMVGDEMRKRMALIAPHARRALMIGSAIDLKQVEVTTFADTLDGLSAGMFLIDGSGSIVHANTAGQDMLNAADFLRSVGGKLVTRDPKIDHSLREAIAAAACSDTEIGSKATALPLTAHNGGRHVAHVLPLTAGARRSAGIAHTAVAAVFVQKTELESPTNVIAQTYKLTPAELRVLLSIVDVGGVPETAEALGVAETTVKTHLYRLFDKAGVSRQADLVKIVAGFANPLVG